MKRSFRHVGELPGAARTAALTELGHLELADEDFSAAVVALSEAESLDPRNHVIQYLLARALVGAGRRDEAGKHFEAYRLGSEATQKLTILMDRIAVEPNNAELRCDIGAILLTHYTENQGLIWLASALEINASHQRANQLMANYYTGKLESTGDRSYQDLARHHSDRLQANTVDSESSTSQ